MAFFTQPTQSHVIGALDSYAFTVPAPKAGLFTADVKLDVSMAQRSAVPCGITITILQNSTSSLVVGPPAASQSHMNARIVLNCAASDVITILIASSAASDQGSNAFKGIITIHEGMV